MRNNIVYDLDIELSQHDLDVLTELFNIFEIGSRNAMMNLIERDHKEGIESLTNEINDVKCLKDRMWGRITPNVS